ncbi:MAG: HU family DNA-binding protein [Candidatus Marsarchaeota archaeon]|nr:HU family DNA-binding protein [Candidatus Marsarchaeota archaeon]
MARRINSKKPHSPKIGEPGGVERKRRLYKTDVVRRVAKETRLSQRAVSDALNGALKQVTLALAQGQFVVFPGLGTFYTRMRKASTARSFETGKPMKVPAMRVAAFRAGELLKQAVRKRKAK